MNSTWRNRNSGLSYRGLGMRLPRRMALNVMQIGKMRTDSGLANEGPEKNPMFEAV
jgi:hypothetical protein